MFTLPALLARERMLHARRVAEQYRLAAGLPRPAAGAGRSKWRSWRTRHARAGAESAASTVHSPLIATFGQSARRLDRPTDSLVSTGGFSS
jgi:hypothetical protein